MAIGTAFVTGVDSMRAVVVKSYGGPEVLRIEQITTPRPASGEVLIETAAAGVGFGDTLRRQGLAGANRPPFIPGYDVVGRIAALGPGVTGWNVGDRVAAYVTYGGYADAVCAPADGLIRVPEGVADDIAVALVLNYGTAYQLLRRAAEVEKGQSVVVTSAAGGVGTAVLDISRALGLSAVGLAAPAKHPVVRQFGGFPVDHRAADAVSQVRRALAERGADAVLDGIGGRHLWQSRAMAAKSGRVILFGVAGTVANGRKRPLGLLPTIVALGTMSLMGSPSIRTYASADEQTKRRAQYASDLNELFAMAAEGRLRPLIDRRIALHEVAAAHREIEAGATSGKIVIAMGERSQTA